MNKCLLRIEYESKNKSKNENNTPIRKKDVLSLNE
jgi:hypothetical protein